MVATQLTIDHLRHVCQFCGLSRSPSSKSTTFWSSFLANTGFSLGGSISLSTFLYVSVGCTAVSSVISSMSNIDTLGEEVLMPESVNNSKVNFLFNSRACQFQIDERKYQVILYINVAAQL